MTARQITKALEAAKLPVANLTISRDEVEVYVRTKDGECDYAKTERLASKICKAMKWGGFRCGHGGWVIQAQTLNMGDPSNPASHWHY